MNNSKLFKTIEYEVSVVLFVILFLGFYSVSKGCILTGAQNDTVAHFYSGYGLVNTVINGTFSSITAAESLTIQIATYPIWHIVTYSVYFIINFFVGSVFTPEAIIAASIALVNSSCIYVTWLLVRKYLKRVLNGKYNVLANIVSMLLLVIGPIDASGILGRYYLGGYTASVWHNAGYIMVRPLAIYCFYKYLDILNNEQNKVSDYFKITIAMLMAGLIKPIFFIAFIPALVVMCIVTFIKNRNIRIFWDMCKIGFTCIPVGILAYIQTMGIQKVNDMLAPFLGLETSSVKGYVASTTNNISSVAAMLTSVNGGIEFGGIGIKFLYVWKTFSSSWWGFSLLVSIVFPLFIFVVMIIKRKWNKEIMLILLFFFSAILQYVFLYIPSHPFSGDFAWGFQLSIFFLFVWAAGQLLDMKMETKLDKIIKVLGLVLFAAHAFFGICYAADIVYTLDILQPLHYFNYDVVNNVFL